MAQHRNRPSVADVWLVSASWEDRREFRRLDASLTALLSRPDHHRSAVTLLDVSTRGCRIRTGALRAGDRVWLDLDGLEPLCAHVAWAEAAEAGLEFRRPLHPTTLAHLTDGAASAPGSAD